jgi:hypothetical protein
MKIMPAPRRAAIALAWSVVAVMVLLPAFTSAQFDCYGKVLGSYNCDEDVKVNHTTTRKPQATSHLLKSHSGS